VRRAQEGNAWQHSATAVGGDAGVPPVALQDRGRATWRVVGRRVWSPRPVPPSFLVCGFAEFVGSSSAKVCESGVHLAAAGGAGARGAAAVRRRSSNSMVHEYLKYFTRKAIEAGQATRGDHEIQSYKRAAKARGHHMDATC
jgi:hypothetical protein